jgi:hypothetical protein
VDELTAEGVFVDGNNSNVCFAKCSLYHFCGTAMVGDGDRGFALAGIGDRGGGSGGGSGGLWVWRVGVGVGWGRGGWRNG